jgi:hypothetical protein
MQVCSFLPSATEILYALDLSDLVAGGAFERDYPPRSPAEVIVGCLARQIRTQSSVADMSGEKSHSPGTLQWNGRVGAGGPGQFVAGRFAHAASHPLGDAWVQSFSESGQHPLPACQSG